MAPTHFPTTAAEKGIEYNTQCLLNGLTCADYGGIGTSQCDSTKCDEKMTPKCSEEAVNGAVLVEYATCIDTPTALMTAIQFTIYAETFVLAIFFLFRLSAKNGLRILLVPKTYFELWNNVAPPMDDQEEGEEENNIKSMEGNLESVEQQQSIEEECELEETLKEVKRLYRDPKEIPEKAANYFFQTAAPNSTVHITGFCLSSFFVLWYILSSLAIFAALFWYFYTGSCTLINTTIDVSQSSDAYQTLFSDGNTHFCTSKMITFYGIYGLGGTGTCGNRYIYECMLDGFTPDSFESHPLCPPSNMKDAFTDNMALALASQAADNIYQIYDGQKYALIDWEAYIANCPIPSYCNAVHPEAQDFLGFDGNCLPKPNHWSNFYYPLSINYGAPTASLTYVTCDPLSSTLATAGQYTFYAQVVIIGFYLLLRKISIEGISVLTEQETYFDLWENEKVILEG
jgi:hypothetical protein